MIRNHCDKLAVRGLTARVLDSIAEITVESIYVASVPRYLDCVADSALNTACCGLIFLRHARIKYLGYAVYHIVVLYGQQYGSAQILVALNVGGDADLVDYPRYLGLNIGSAFIVLLLRRLGYYVSAC